MKNLTLTGFKNLCKKITPTSFIYDTENQPRGIKENVKMTARYSDVIFMLNPNRICFKGETGTLCFDRVKLIRHYDDAQTVGEVFSIVCGNTQNTNADVSYTIIADAKNF